MLDPGHVFLWFGVGFVANNGANGVFIYHLKSYFFADKRHFYAGETLPFLRAIPDVEPRWLRL